jgi:hypothetical protein
MSSLVQAIAVCRSYAVETRTLDVLRGVDCPSRKANRWPSPG